MTVWCRLPAIFNRRYVLQLAVPLMLLIALITTLLFTGSSYAVPSTNKTVSFQGRLLTPGGAVVPDGSYNIQFKIYQDGAGTAVNNPGGSLVWTESYINNNANSGVLVKNGYFSVSLGSINQFGSSVDWDQDTLWLSMNIAGSANACTSFGTAPCGGDGEMLPMKQITASPYALNAGALGGKTASDFIQFGQGVQIDASTNTNSIFINKTGSGNLIQLQNTATDVFTVANTGDLTLGSNANKSITISTSAENTDGRQLAISGGGGGAGAGSAGGDLTIQGGAAGGTNGDGGNISIDAGARTGSGSNGTISIGSTNASSISIGSNSLAVNQTISIGANNTSGSISNVTVGSGGSAAGGTTNIQAKNSVTVMTNGTTRATFSDTTNVVYFGNGVTSAAPNDFTIQGTDSSASAVSGGSLTVQGGNATTGNTNGGNVTLSGGAGSGTGASGLVILTTPTFSTTNNDANCYTAGALVASSCTITKASIDNSAAVIIGFSSTGQTATLPDPTISTAGRIIYIMAAGNSQDFTLSANDGGQGNEVTMRQNTATTMIWNGSNWLVAGASSSTTLQDAYNNTPQSAGGTEILLNNNSNTGGLTIRDSTVNPVNGTLLDVQSATNNTLFSVNSNVTDGTEHATDGNVNDSGNFTTNWTEVGDSSVTRSTSDGQEGSSSAQVAAGTSADSGVRNKLSIDPQTNTRYRVSVYAKLESGSEFTDFKIRYSPDDGSTFADCVDYNSRAILNGGWTQITCYIDTPATTAVDPYVYFVQPTTAADARTYFVDTFSFTLAPNLAPNVKIGNEANGSTTLFTIDKSALAPIATDHSALLGSMYYDTTLGKVQCYEANGWGSCGASPDNFITLSPEYTNAVTHGNGVGTMSSDLCSDTLNINDGSSSQPTICSTNETYNFYKWASPEVTNQVRSIFVTYQLPASFKEFVSGSTSLMGRTDSADSSITYNVYRNRDGTGLTPCGTTKLVSTGPQSTWQKGIAADGMDPAACNFTAGDSIVFRIDLNAANSANAYISNLGFTFSNH